MTFLTGNPSDRFMLWTRRVLLLVWAVLLITQLPSFFEQAQHILSSAVSGPDRNAALRRLAGEAFAILVIVPLFLLVVLATGSVLIPPLGSRAALGSGLGGALAIDRSRRRGMDAYEVSNFAVHQTGVRVAHSGW